MQRWDRFLSECVGFTLSVSFHRLLLPEGQIGKAFEPSKKHCSLHYCGALDSNMFSLFVCVHFSCWLEPAKGASTHRASPEQPSQHVEDKGEENKKSPVNTMPTKWCNFHALRWQRSRVFAQASPSPNWAIWCSQAVCCSSVCGQYGCKMCHL